MSEETILAIIIAIIGSSGVWAVISKLIDIFSKKKNTPERRLLLGLAHDRIMDLGSLYLSREPSPYITQDEYENLNDYLWEPYKENGGNGSAERIMAEINRLPIRSNHVR